LPAGRHPHDGSRASADAIENRHPIDTDTSSTFLGRRVSRLDAFAALAAHRLAPRFCRPSLAQG